MATIIDALIVTLGLDASTYVKGTAAAQDAQKKLTANERQASKDAVEFSNKRTEAYRKITTTVIGLYAAFTAGKGIREFVASITTGDAATGRLAKQLNMSAASLSTWEAAAERAGGSASGMAGSFQGLMGDLQGFALTGQSAVVPYLRALGIGATDASGKLRPMEDILLDVNKAVQGMDPARATALLQGLRLDQSTINLMLLAPKALRDLLEETRKGASVSDADTKAASLRQSAFAKLTQQSEKMGRTILTAATPALIKMMELLDRLEMWVESHSSQIAGWVENFAHTLAGIDWEGAWKKAVELGDRFVGILDRIASFRMPAWMATLVGFSSAPSIHDPNDPSSGKSGTAFGRTVLPTWLGGNADPSKPAAPYTPSLLDRARNFANGFFGGKAWSKTEASPGAYKPILDLVGRTEGTDKGRGYNETLGYGRYTGGNQNLTGMTLNQIVDLQGKMLANPDNKMNSSALGRYQITRSTLSNPENGLIKQLGLTGNELFSPEMQDRLASHLIKTRVKGSMEAMQKGLAGIWASVPKPGGGSAYAGQNSAASSAEVQSVLRNSMGNTADRYAANRGGARVSSNETSINGPITIHTRANDAKGIANDLHFALRGSFATQANTGLA